MQKIASIGRFLLEGAFGKGALFLLDFVLRLGERALRPTQLLHEQPFALLAIRDAGEVKGRRSISLLRSGFQIVVHVRPPIIDRYVPLPYDPNEKPPTR